MALLSWLHAWLFAWCLLAETTSARSLQTSSKSLSKPLPFVVLHGIGDECSNPGMSSFVELLIKLSGANGICLEIGDGAADSWTMRLDHQAEEVCKKVKQLPHLAGGFNLVGLSQGALIARGYIQWCEDAPPVQNLISLGGPHAGVASIPLCGLTVVCRLIDAIMKLGVYSPFVQDHVAPTGYVKIPTDLKAYYKGCMFLPLLNNELPNNKNETSKMRLSSLRNLVLIKFAEDTVVVPRESAHFGYYAEGSFYHVLAVNETALYKEDWIGLRSLDEAGKVHFLTVPGNHLQISTSMIGKTVIPFLNDSSVSARGA